MKKLCTVFLLFCSTVFAADFCANPPTNNQSLAGYVLDDYGTGANDMTLTQGVFVARSGAGGAAMFNVTSQSRTNLSFMATPITNFTLFAVHKYYTTNTIDIGIYKPPSDTQPLYIQHYLTGVLYYQCGVSYALYTNTSTDWAFIAMVFNGTNATTTRIRGYYNETAFYGTTTLSNALVSTHPFVIGRMITVEPWRGDVSDIGMCTESLNDQEIGAIYTNLMVSYTTNWHTTFATKRDATIYRFDCYTAPPVHAASTDNKAVYLLQQMIGQ